MRRASIEMEIKVSNGRITSAEILKDGTSCKVTVEVDTEGVNADDVVVLGEAPKLRLKEDFSVGRLVLEKW